MTLSTASKLDTIKPPFWPTGKVPAAQTKPIGADDREGCDPAVKKVAVVARSK